MSANKKNKLVELTGTVAVKNFGAGSKSEHEAVWLETETDAYVLRRVGGNPFQDTALQKLKGKTITAKGIISNYLFLVSEIKIET